MSIPTAPKTNKDKLTARERALRAELASPVAAQRQVLLSRLKPWLLAALGLLIGVGLGVLVMRHRHESQDNLAAVNGVNITKDQLFERLQLAAGPAMMQRMVGEQLDLQFAAKKGSLPTDEQVEEKFQKLHSSPTFARELAASGMSESDYKASLRVKLAQVAVLTQGVTVTDAEVQNYYKSQIDPGNSRSLFYQPETVLVRAIGTPDQARIARAQQELASNTPFELVASQYSVDPGSKNRGGLLQPLVLGRNPISPTPALEQAVFNLKIGAMYGPVAFHKGYWIFRMEEKKPAQTRPFAEVKDDCVQNAEVLKGNQLHGKAIEAEFKDFRDKSVLQAFVPLYQPVMVSH